MKKGIQMQKNMKKKIGIIVLVVGGLLLLTGSIFTSLKDNKADNKGKEEVKEKVKVPEENNNEFVKEEHCLDDLCVETLTIRRNEETKRIEVLGEITNKSSAVVPAGYIKIFIFQDNKEYAKIVPYAEIPVNGKTPINYEDDDELLLIANDYSLVTPTPTEIEQASKDKK